MAGKIFINYRRGDAPGYTQALYQRLKDEFASGDLFMDMEGHTKPGDDFVEALNSQVASSDVVLVVIGPRWADLLAARQNDKDDFVAIEIKAALDQGKRVVPVLVGGARMPRRDSLPESIRQLAWLTAVDLRPERFGADCQGLITALREQLALREEERDTWVATAPPPASAPPPMTMGRRGTDRRLLALALAAGLLAGLSGLAAYSFLSKDVETHPLASRPTELRGASSVDKVSGVSLANAGLVALPGHVQESPLPEGSYVAVFEHLSLEDVDTMRTASPDWSACARLCLETKDCAGFAFDTASEAIFNCILKATTKVAVQHASGVVGVIVKGGRHQPALLGALSSTKPAIYEFINRR
jgi:hypothetical protein